MLKIFKVVSPAGKTLLGAFVLIVGGYIAYSVNAATDSGNVALEGTVAATVNIAVTPAGNYNNLDISTLQTVTDEVIASVVETTNTSYNVSVSSTNLTAGTCSVTTGPCLDAGTGAATDVDLTLKIGGSTISFTGASNEYKSAASAAPSGTTAEDVSLTYTIATALPAGTYTETLTFTITSV